VHLKDQVSAQVMKEAIGMARWLVKTSVKVKVRLANAQRELTLHRDAQKMLTKTHSRGQFKQVAKSLSKAARSF